MNANQTTTLTAAARFARRSFVVRASLVALALTAAGCASSADLGERDERTFYASTRPTTGPAATLLSFQTFAVQAVPPAGWERKTNSIDDRSEHITWVSPSGRSAYGIVFFKLPFPVGHELAFTRGYLAEVRRVEGEPEVIEKYWDEQLGGLRFIVRSPRYRVEAKFFVKGLRGYTVYAGSRSDLPIDEAEMTVGRAARESTRFSHEIKPGETRATEASAR